MKTDKLNRLITALGKPSTTQQVKLRNVAQAEPARQVQARRLNDDAVKIATGFGKTNSTSNGEDAARARKVAAIKEQVASGSYKVKSEDVAASVVAELGL